MLGSFVNSRFIISSAWINLFLLNEGSKFASGRLRFLTNRTTGGVVCLDFLINLTVAGALSNEQRSFPVSVF